MEDIKLARWEAKSEAPQLLQMLSPDYAQVIRRFHKSFPQYEETKLHSLKNLATHLGISGIFVKDESSRFGLNAFKSLGATVAIGCVLAEKLGTTLDAISYDLLMAPHTQKKLGTQTFLTATDGNHGRAVAWAANTLGQKSIVYMPKGSAPERLANIQKEGADAAITALAYDDTVRFADSEAKKHKHILLQDTAWSGYEEIPNAIMAGYLTMALEAVEQLDGTVPTHIFLQAGVGSFAGAMTSFFHQYYKENPPLIIIVEPNKADCYYRSALANDASAHFVTDEMDTIMAGLACGEPSTTAFPLIRDCAHFALSCPDFVSALGMRILASPLPGDSSIISGESGALPLGTAVELLTNSQYETMRKTLNLGESSKILCFSTEGDTDKTNYRKIVWEGSHPKTR